MKRLFEVDTICRLCLRVDDKVNRLYNIDQKVFIESIIKLKQENYVPTDDLYICYICSALLTKSFNFMQTIWSAQKIICALLQNTDMITKQQLYCIDRHNTGLNPITLIEIVTYCDSEQCDSSYYNSSSDSSTCADNKLILSISDEDEESDKCKLDEIEVQICNNFEIDVIRADSSDPLTKELGSDEPIPKTKVRKPVKKNKWCLKTSPTLSSNDSTPNESDIETAFSGKKRKTRYKDEDYQPDSTSHSEDSDFDSYDDDGKPIKKPKDDRVYPMQCDHCDFEVLERRNHYRHYQYNHPNIEYPYSIQKEYACSICGKLYDKQRIGSHEASHTIQKLKCYFCPKVCSSKLRRLTHMSSVHPKKTFTCDYCAKVFKTKGDILRHLRTHTGSKPFKCHICGDGFAHSGNRSVHIRAIHQNYRYVAKKQKQAQTVRRKKKHRSTDTEISSNSEKTVRKTKTKRKSNNQSENTETTLKKKKKSTKKVSKNKEIDGTETSVVSEDGKQDNKKKKKTEMVSEINIERHNKDYENAEIDSDDEILAVVKRKNTQDGPVSQKAKQVDEENKVK